MRLGWWRCSAVGFDHGQQLLRRKGLLSASYLADGPTLCLEGCLIPTAAFFVVLSPTAALSLLAVVLSVELQESLSALELWPSRPEVSS